MPIIPALNKLRQNNLHLKAFWKSLVVAGATMGTAPPPVAQLHSATSAMMMLGWQT
jgi:hypothetical protein